MLWIYLREAREMTAVPGQDLLATKKERNEGREIRKEKIKDNG